MTRALARAGLYRTRRRFESARPTDPRDRFLRRIAPS
jgi:hypothetical protein